MSPTDIAALANLLNVSADEINELFTMSPMLEQQSFAEIKHSLSIFAEFGISPLDAATFIWIFPNLFILSPNELRAYLNKKKEWCEQNNIDFVDRVYNEPDIFVDD